MNMWYWFKPFLGAAAVAVYTILVLWSIMFDTAMPGLWIGQ